LENRIKECQLGLFADRTSTAMRTNQLRLWFASVAYVLIEGLRRIGPRATKLANATCGFIHLKLFKIGALVRVSVRRVKPSPLAILGSAAGRSHTPHAPQGPDANQTAHSRQRRSNRRSLRKLRHCRPPPDHACPLELQKRFALGSRLQTLRLFRNLLATQTLREIRANPCSFNFTAGQGAGGPAYLFVGSASPLLTFCDSSDRGQWGIE